jgi:hypothetical protein
LSDFDRETELFCTLPPTPPPRHLENPVPAQIAERASIAAASRAGQFVHFRVVTPSLPGTNEKRPLSGPTKRWISRLDNHRTSIRSNAGINNRQMDCAGWKIAISGAESKRRRVNIVRQDVMCDIYQILLLTIGLE